jgi:diaminopimelate epimerase
MLIPFYKYQGAGNDFIMIDNRQGHFPKGDNALIHRLCDRRFGIGADGLIVLEDDVLSDFNMVYFNADGNEGSLCGNGGRCTVAFARSLKIIDDKTQFRAVDGLHNAMVENSIIRLQMPNVQKDTINTSEDFIFLDTGSPHHVAFYDSVDELNVFEMGRTIRYGDPYAENGVNVNFVAQIDQDHLKVRTYERGVENETLACGTGVTACAIASYFTGRTESNTLIIDVLGGQLEVSFVEDETSFCEVYLSGPATFVFEGEIEIG